MPFAKNNFQNIGCWVLKRETSSALTFGSRVTARIASTTLTDKTWKESTSAPLIKPNLAKKICSAQKAENSRTFNSGEVFGVLIVLISSENIFPGMLVAATSRFCFKTGWQFSLAPILPIVQAL